MNPIIRLLSVLLFAIGAAFSFGVWRTFPAVPKTVTFVFLPLLHLAVGAGLWMGKPTARSAAFFLALFYMFLGILVWNKTVLAIDFIPIVPLVEFIPTQVLRLDVSLVKGLGFFALPLAVVLILSLRSVGFSFEPFLQGRFSWSTPFSLLLASAFIFSYSLLAVSETNFFLGGTGRSLFGYSLNPAAEKAVSYAEFCLPFILAFAFTAGEIWAWLFGLVYGVYYWLPYLVGGFRPDDLHDFKFLFFGAGWLLTALVLLFSWPFFWKQELWAECRAAGKRNWFYSILFLILAGGVAAGAVLYLFPGLKTLRLPYPEQIKKSVSSAPAGETIAKPAPPPEPKLRLEGTSIDSQGAYALINGELVKAGALVNGFRVETVGRNEVILSKEGKHYRLARDGQLKGL